MNMTLEDYYRLNNTALFCSSSMAEQLKEVRNDITSFLEGFTKACNEDLEAEKVASVIYLQYAYCINAYFTCNKEKLLGLGQYLLDFQGQHDAFFDTPSLNMVSFAYAILKFNPAFNEAHYRLLEITGIPNWAYMAINRDNVAKYVLSHFEDIISDNTIPTAKSKMTDLMNALQKMKTNIEENSSYKFSDFVPQYLLYKLLKRKLSPFRKL